jgi:integrase/recombinase XerD
MLELYFKYPKVIQRLRSGALGGDMDRIAAHLFEIGCKHASAKIYISQLSRFTEFAGHRGRVSMPDQNPIDRFMRRLPTAASRIAAQTVIKHARRLAPERF